MQSNRLVTPFGLVVLGLVINSQAAFAQIVQNGAGTVVAAPTAGGVINITGGTLAEGPVRNQFHSFGQFDLPQGQTANFIPAAIDANGIGITNILGRITSPGASVINGVVQVPPYATGLGPNLYLMNPAGIIFGPNASLNLPASFAATTAGAIGFGNGTTAASYFNAYPAAGETLTTLTGGPSSMIFPPGFTGSVVNLGTLAVPPGQALGLYGNSVVNAGDITSPGSYVSAYSVPSPRFLRYRTPGNLFSLEIPTNATFEAPSALAGGVTVANLPELITGNGAAIGNATSIRVAGGQVFLTGGGAGGADVAVNQGELASRNINVTRPAASLTADNAPSVRLFSGGNLVAGNISNQIPAGQSINFLGDIQLYSGSAAFGTAAGVGLNPAGGVQTGNLDAANVEIRSGGAVNTANITTTGLTPNQPDAIRILNLGAGDITTGTLTANNVNLAPAAGQSGGGNIVISSIGNFTSRSGATISNNAGVGAAGGAANLPNGGGEVRIIAGNGIGGGARGAGVVTTGDISSASIDIDGNSGFNLGNLFTQGFTMAGRPVAIRLVGAGGNGNVSSLFANNVNAQGAAAGGGNIVVNLPGGSFIGRNTISRTVLGNAGSSLSTAGANGGAVTGSAITVASRGSTTINQRGVAGSNFLQGGNLQRDANGVLFYRLANNQVIRVLIQGNNADGSLRLVDATSGQAVSGGNIIIRSATTNRIPANPGGGASGLIVRLGNATNAAGAVDRQSGNVVGILGETTLPASTGGNTITETNQIAVTTAQGTVDTGTVIPGVRGIGPELPVTPAPTPIAPGPDGVPATNENLLLLQRSQDVERSSPEIPLVVLTDVAGPALSADSLASAQETGILTQKMERTVAIPLDIPENKEEIEIPQPKQQVKPKLKTIPQLW
jgi:filamentous hemagglutinin family protein